MTSQDRVPAVVRSYLNWKVGFFILNTFLFAVLFFTVVGMVRAMVVRPSIVSDVSGPAPTVPEPVTVHPLSYYEPLIESKIFGSSSEVTSKPQQAAIRLETLPKTTLKLTLVGTVIDPETGSYAIIVDSSLNKADTYKPGDILSPGVELLEVYPRRVVIQRDGGQREVLEMLFEARAGSMMASLPRPRGELRRLTPTFPSSSVKELDRAQIAFEIDGLAQEVLNDVQYSQNKLFRGRRGLGIDKITPGSRLSQYGIQSGDVILAVNGQAVRSLTDAMALLPQLKDADEVRVTVGRGNGFKTLTFRLR